jgi:hypothetical protein
VAVFHSSYPVALCRADLTCSLCELMSFVAWWACAVCLEVAKQKQADCCEERPLAVHTISLYINQPVRERLTNSNEGCIRELPEQ